jgi:hypothetical protein
VVGYGEHGAMVELFYDGDWNDVEGLTVLMRMSQHGKEKETQHVKVLGGRHLAELTEGIYKLGKIDVEILIKPDATLPANTAIDLEVEYGQLFPWMVWYYGNSGLSDRVHFPNPNHPEAYDLQPTSVSFPEGLEHPVSSPCVGEIYQSTELQRDDGKVYHNMWIFCTYSGFYVQMGHMHPQLAIGKRVDSETIVGYLSNETGWPHNHTTVRQPTTSPRKSQITDNSRFVDLFNPHVQLGGRALAYGLWLPDTLPLQVRDLIDAGVFEADYDSSR